MKKIVAIAAFLLFFLGKNDAQGDIRFGFQASPVFSWMNTDDNQINNNGANFPGLKLGLLGEYYFRENYAFFGGIGFAFNQGGTLLHDEGGRFWPQSGIPALTEQDTIGGTFPAGSNLKYKIQYVEIPFGLKLMTKEFGYLRYYAEVPVITLGFKSQARGIIEGDGIAQAIEDEKFDIKKEVVGLSLSWGFGLGAEYSVSASTAVALGLHYQRIFTDITKDNDSDNSKAHMNNLIIRLAVMF